MGIRGLIEACLAIVYTTPCKINAFYASYKGGN